MTGSEFTPWPCLELKQYPLSSDWTDSFPMKRLSRYRYIHVINATRTFFQEKEMLETYAQFRQYSFVQGNVSNANAMDFEFFYSMLSHDYPFFLGHKQTEIQASFKIDSEKLQGMDILKSSHFDLYRVEQARAGFARLQSLTNPGILTGFVSLTERPKAGDVIFGRLMPVGLIPRALAFSFVEPWDTVDPSHVEGILETFRRQYEAFKEKFPETTTRAFMKICGYHFYEAIQARELIPFLNEKLKHLKDEVEVKTVSYIFTDPGLMPKLAEIEGMNVINDGKKGTTWLGTIGVCEDRHVPETLREAIVTKEDRTIEVTLFMRDAGRNFLQEVFEPKFKKAKTIRKEHVHDENETYRSLRHLSLVHR